MKILPPYDNLLAAELWVMNADGSGKTQLTNDTRAKGRTSFGPKIAFAYSCPYLNHPSGIYTINPEGSGFALVPGTEVQHGAISGIDWSSRRQQDSLRPRDAPRTTSAITKTAATRKTSSSSTPAAAHR